MEARPLAESRPVLDILTSEIIVGWLCVVASPLLFVIIAGGWPRALIALLALDLPVRSAYFPARFHRYIKPSKRAVTIWKTPSTFSGDNASEEVIFVVSGTPAFIHAVLSLMSSQGVHRTIALIEFPIRSTSRSLVKSQRFKGCEVLLEFGLRPVDFWDRDCGGATDANHTLGFGTGLRLDVLPLPEPGLALGLRHFIDDGTEVGNSWTVLLALVPIMDLSAQVRWHENILLSCGLFPRQRPRALVYCSCYRLPPDKLVVRPLTSHEMLQLYHLPLSMDALLAELDLDLPLPYEDLAPSGFFTSVLRQLWGVVGGGSASVLAEGSSEGERSPTGEEDDVVVGSIGGEEEDETVDRSQHPWVGS